MVHVVYALTACTVCIEMYASTCADGVCTHSMYCMQRCIYHGYVLMDIPARGMVICMAYSWYRYRDMHANGYTTSPLIDGVEYMHGILPDVYPLASDVYICYHY